MNKPVKICLAWHNLNSNNFGVGALSISHVIMLLKAAKGVCSSVSIVTMGTPNVSEMTVKEDIGKKYGIQIRHIDFTFRSVLCSMLKMDFSPIMQFQEYDLILDIGEGDSFTDIYGLKRFSLLCFTKIIPILLNKRLILSPQTIGPFEKSLTNMIARWIMKRTDKIFVRDHMSASYVRSLGLKCIEVSDLAFLLSYTKKETRAGTVGVNISGLLWNGGYSGANQFNLGVEYPRFIKELVQEFRLRGKEVHLIGHVITDTTSVEDDYRVCQEVKDLFYFDDSVILAPRFLSPIEAKTYISQLEFFTGSRMHATIAALSSGVITVPIAYSRKFEGLFGSIGYHYTLNAYELNTDNMLKKILDYYDNSFDKMQQCMQSAREKSIISNNEYMCYLEELLNNG